MVKERVIKECSVDELIRDSLIDFCLKEKNKEMFDMLLSKDWKKHIISEEKDNEFIEEKTCWEVELLKNTIGDIEYYYKNKPVYDKKTQDIIDDLMRKI